MLNVADIGLLTMTFLRVLFELYSEDEASSWLVGDSLRLRRDHHHVHGSGSV